MHFDFITIDYTDHNFNSKIITENLISKTLKEDDTLYLILIIYKDLKNEPK